MLGMDRTGDTVSISEGGCTAVRRRVHWASEIDSTKGLSGALGVRKRLRQSTSRPGRGVRGFWDDRAHGVVSFWPRRPARGRPVPGYRVNPEQEGGLWTPQPS